MAPASEDEPGRARRRCARLWHPRPRVVRKATATHALVAALVAGTVGVRPARAHDITLELEDLERGVRSIARTLATFERRPPVPRPPRTPADQRRALGEAEIEAALGHPGRALRILLGRLEDPAFRSLPERIDALLLSAEVLERQGELAGALAFAREALERGGAPEDMAEAGARWFRLARLTSRLDDRLRLYELWTDGGGEGAAGTEAAARVRYEVAFALRSEGRRAEARRLLAEVPSGSAVGSRAAYLAGALFVEDGNLRDAERWFAAIMAWPIPDAFDARQRAIEEEVRALAALSTARLRYERGDLAEAAAAYAQVPEGSRHRREACWELAYLEAERGRHRAALANVRCVARLGAPGARRVELELLESALLAHLDRYADSVRAYERLHDDVVEERDLVRATVRGIEDPAELLFSGMERTAVTEGPEASPGPATLFGGAWTPELDRAYRVDRGTREVLGAIAGIAREVRSIEAVLERSDGFEPLELRRRNLQRVLREIDHLTGHAGQIELAVGRRHASALVVEADHHHADDARAVGGLLETLSAQRVQVQARIAALEGEADRRREAALTALGALKSELRGLRSEVGALVRDAEEPVTQAARAALDRLVAELDDAAMRAEVGVLDTFWLKKQERTREVERLLLEQEEVERQLDEALGDLDR